MNRDNTERNVAAAYHLVHVTFRVKTSIVRASGFGHSVDYKIC